jgi:predicted glycoside hydrolase/deacetylase ChbG (UPF0249 family)
MKRQTTNSMLVVTADDFGIGPETSRAILDLACHERISAAVLLVNSPYAEQAARAWKAASPNADLGWHANLTIDRPILSPKLVPSLVDETGHFWPLEAFLWRWATRRIKAAEVEHEWSAQWKRYCDLVGRAPDMVNAHQHVAVLGGPSTALLNVLKQSGRRPFVRRVCEPFQSVWNCRNARIKRSVLATLGARQASKLKKAGYPGCDFLAGVANNDAPFNADFYRERLAAIPSGNVELMVHPGHRDETLIDRDCQLRDGGLRRRVAEWKALTSREWSQFLEEHTSRIVRPSMHASSKRGAGYAA